MTMNLLVWHWDPEYPFGQLQTIRVRPNRVNSTHLPPLRHGHSTKPGVGEAVGVAVTVAVVVMMAGVGVGDSHNSVLGVSMVSLVTSKPLPSESKPSS